MMIPITELLERFEINPKGIVHLGAYGFSRWLTRMTQDHWGDAFNAHQPRAPSGAAE